MKASILIIIVFSALIETFPTYADSRVGGKNKATAEKVVTKGVRVYLSSVNLNNRTINGKVVVNSEVQDRGLNPLLAFMPTAG